MARACESPQQFPIVVRDIRRVVVSRFPYSVFFRVRPACRSAATRLSSLPPRRCSGRSRNWKGSWPLLETTGAGRGVLSRVREVVVAREPAEERRHQQLDERLTGGLSLLPPFLFPLLRNLVLEIDPQAIARPHRFAVCGLYSTPQSMSLETGRLR